MRPIRAIFGAGCAPTGREAESAARQPMKPRRSIWTVPRAALPLDLEKVAHRRPTPTKK
jgi:hypothetical protein